MNAITRTILVVDDEASLRRVLERSLSREGYRVLSCGSAEAAYSTLEAERVDAVLLDIHLPTMSGLGLYRAIVNAWSYLEGRIAIMTGDAEAEPVRTWLEKERCVVLRKPFDLREIAVWLESIWRNQERESGNG